RARLQLANGDIAKAQSIILENTKAGTAETEPAWLLLRSEMRMRQGNIAGAIEDGEAALTKGHTEETQATRGMLYAAALRYKESAELLEPLLERISTGKNTESISDEELGRIVLQTYISRKRQTPPLHGSKMLASYAANYKGGKWWQHFFRSSL